MSYRSWIRLSTDDSWMVFVPRFKTINEATNYTQFKVSRWDNVEDFGIIEVDGAPTTRWYNGRLVPLTSTNHY